MGKRNGRKNIDVIQRVNTFGEKVPWYRLLSVAIVCRAVMDIEELDYYGTNVHNSGLGNVYRAELETFSRSEWCKTLMCGVENWDGTSLEKLVSA